jgi:hypothetical protein
MRGHATAHRILADDIGCLLGDHDDGASVLPEVVVAHLVAAP